MAAAARGDGVLSEGSQLLRGLNQDGSSEIEPIYGPGRQGLPREDPCLPPFSSSAGFWL